MDINDIPMQPLPKGKELQERTEEYERRMAEFGDNPEVRRFHQSVSARLQDQRARRKLFGETWDDFADVQVQLLNAKPFSTMNLETISVDIWVEDEMDICVDILPAARRATFPDFELARVQINRVMRRVFEDVPKIRVECDAFGFRFGEIVPRSLDPTDRGRDMFHLRFIHLFKRPNAPQFVVEAAVVFDEVLTGRRSPVVM